MSDTTTRELLRQLPKAELHCHLDGSLRAETLLELAREYGITLPRDDVESLRQFMIVHDARHLEDYLARFTVTLSVMQRAEALERIAFELAEDAHRDGAWYIEVRFAPVLNVREGLQTHQVVEAVVRGLDRAEKKYGIIGRVIVTALRNESPHVSVELARLAVSMKGKGVVGFDLAGGEQGHPASRHAAAFEFARTHDMACTCHAGEGFGPASIREAVHACAVHRIGHGTRLYEDRSLMDYVNDRRIPVEICITSNVQTRVAESYEEHPVRRFFDEGLNVVLNTDNRLMSGTTLTDEYALAHERLGFTVQELGRMAINGFASAFLPWPERQHLMARASARIAELTGAKR